MTVRRVVSIVAAVGLVATGLVLGATLADAGPGPNSIVVTKVVQGPVPPGTTFIVDVDCDEDAFDNQAMFPATGGSEVILVGLGVDQTCTVAETQTGGAVATTFACQVTDVGVNDPPTCQGTNAAVSLNSLDSEVTITVTNTFVPPPEPAAAEPVEAAPTFTG